MALTFMLHLFACNRFSLPAKAVQNIVVTVEAEITQQISIASLTPRSFRKVLIQVKINSYIISLFPVDMQIWLIIRLAMRCSAGVGNVTVNCW